MMSNGAVEKYCTRRQQMRTKFDDSVQVVHTRLHPAPGQDALTAALATPPAHAAASVDEWFSHAQARAKSLQAKADAHLPTQSDQSNADAGQQDDDDNQPGVIGWHALHEDNNWGFLKKNPNH